MTLSADRTTSNIIYSASSTIGPPSDQQESRLLWWVADRLTRSPSVRATATAVSCYGHATAQPGRRRGRCIPLRPCVGRASEEWGKRGSLPPPISLVRDLSQQGRISLLPKDAIKLCSHTEQNRLQYLKKYVF